MCEVVSRFEYEVATRYLDPENVVFNGPVKRINDLKEALSRSCMVNIDSFREIQYLETISPCVERIEIGLRISPPWDRQDGPSRFGFRPDEKELDRALEMLRRIPNLTIIGLHCHASGRGRGVDHHVMRVHELMKLRETLKKEPKVNISIINVGGGYIGEMPHSLKCQFPDDLPSMRDYAKAIGKEMLLHENGESVKLIVEPGVSMVANTMCLIAEVVEIRKRGEKNQALLDTNINQVNPTRSQRRPVVSQVIKKRKDASCRENYRLVGNTCMEHDVLVEEFVGCLEEGDFVAFENRGAYSINYTPPFIVPAPAVVDVRGEVLKSPDTFETVLQAYVE